MNLLWGLNILKRSQIWNCELSRDLHKKCLILPLRLFFSMIQAETRLFLLLSLDWVYSVGSKVCHLILCVFSYMDIGSSTRVTFKIKNSIKQHTFQYILNYFYWINAQIILLGQGVNGWVTLGYLGLLWVTLTPKPIYVKDYGGVMAFDAPLCSEGPIYWGDSRKIVKKVYWDPIVENNALFRSKIMHFFAPHSYKRPNFWI